MSSARRWVRPVLRWAFATSCMVVGLGLLSVLDARSADLPPPAFFAWLIPSGLLFGIAMAHWSAVLAAPLTWWLIVLVANAVQFRTVDPLLPGNWLESLGEPNFYFLFPLAFCAEIGWLIGSVGREVLIERRRRERWRREHGA